MPEFLENPRRVPRVEIRCQVRIFLATGAVDTTTEDIGSRGCRVVLPGPARRGDEVGLALSVPRYPATLRVDGRVAWVSPKPPWRVGIAYAAQVLPDATRWFEGLRQAVPELFAGRRPQHRLAVDAMVFLGPVPTLSDFREDELAVLRAVGAGVRVGDLRTALSRTWPRMHRALFALLARGHVIVSRAAATHPVKWKHVLGDPLRPGELPVVDGEADDLELLGDGAPPLELDTAPPVSSRVTSKVPVVSGGLPPSRRISEGIEPIETPLATRAPPSRATPPPRPPPPPPGTAPQPARAHTPPPLPGPEFQGPAARHPAAAPAQPRPPAPDFAGAGVGWRAPAKARSSEANDLLKLGLAEIEAHRPHGALALLRRALSLAPGDPEIASAIGRAMRPDETVKP